MTLGHPRHIVRPRRARRWKIALAILGALLVVLIALAATQLLRSPPALAARPSLPSSYRAPGTFLASWAPGAENVVSLEGAGVMGAVGGQREIAVASVTKLMSVLVILADHPLQVGQSGPEIPITAADVSRYQQEKAAQDSVIALQLGEHLSELQALEAALIPSADDVIQVLANWDAGSTAAFVAKMNAEARHLGLRHTHYVGPSGVNPGNVSTAADQTRLAQLAMSNPVIAGIVAMPQVTLPVAGLCYNVNADLGHAGIFGVKTGWVPAGGASFVFAAHHVFAGRTETIIGALVGLQATPAIPSALADAQRLVTSVRSQLSMVRPVRRGETVATIQAPWGDSAAVKTTAGATLVAWHGARVALAVTLRRHLKAPVAAGTRVGMLSVSLGQERRTIPLVTAAALATPSFSWRLLHG